MTETKGYNPGSISESSSSQAGGVDSIIAPKDRIFQEGVQKYE
jgi:hypothetical protein